MTAETIATRLAANAAAHPHQDAIDDGREPLSYRELDALVDRVAGYLVATLPPVPAGQPDRPMVGVLTSRARDVSVASFAAARAGMVSVAIDPTAPLTRQQAIVDDAAIDLVLTGGGLAWEGGVAIDEAAKAGAIEQPVDVCPDDLSAILYTSGSTGIPKGVRFSHRARLAAVHALAADTSGAGVRACGMDAGSVGVAEIVQVGPIVRAGTILPFSVQEHGIGALPLFMREHRADSIRGVPTMLRHLVSLLPPEDPKLALTAVQLFGESVTWDDIDNLVPALAPGARVNNGYGSTEAGVLTRFAVGADARGTGPLPAGWPVDGVTVLIVDDDDQLVDAGVSGHIVGAGAGLPDGYWKRDEETARTFLRLDDGTMLVRTGDRGLLTADGCLMVHGRADDVVKIAGHRVELGEVEVALSAIAGVHAATATARPDRRGDLRLLAYVVARPGHALDPAVLRAAAARKLPRAMIPDVVMVLDELPSLPSGKVDRSALPDRPRSDLSVTHDDLGSAVRQIFAEILDRTLDEVGPDDDFFDLGGDSLRAVQLLVALEEVTGRPLPPERLMEAPTPATMTTSIESDHHLDPASCIIPVRPGGDRSPLLFVPGGNGQPWAARGLAGHLPEDQPVYAAQAPEARGDGTSPDALEEVAATYVAALRTIEPDGPYHLVGWSAGGLVAFEMARQLQSTGAEVGVLVLGDSAPPGWQSDDFVPPEQRTKSRPPSVIDRLRGRRHLAWSDLPAAVISDTRRITNRVRAAARRPSVGDAIAVDERAHREVEAAEWRGRVFRSTLELHQSYRPAPYPGRAVLLHCVGTDRQRIAGWQTLCEGGLDVHDIDAEHTELFVEPALTEVSTILQHYLDAP